MMESTMSYKKMQERHLALVNKNIMLAEKIVAQEEMHIDLLAANGADTTKSEKALLMFKHRLQELCIHRELILAALNE
jgi:hypothetical protein